MKIFFNIKLKNHIIFKYKSNLQKNIIEGRWSYTEQRKFIKALSKNGPNWKKIQESINF